MASIFDNINLPSFGGSQPSAPGQVPLNPQVQGLLDQGVANASRPTSDFAADTNKNVAAYGNASGRNTQQYAQEDASQGYSPGQFQALRNVYSANAGDSINRIQRTNEYQSEFQKSQQLRQMAMAAQGQQQAEVQQYSMLTQAYNSTEAARAAAVNQIFQTGDVAMGMAAGRGRGNKDMFASEMMNNVNRGGRVGGPMPDESGSGYQYGNDFSNVS